MQQHFFKDFFKEFATTEIGHYFSKPSYTSENLPILIFYYTSWTFFEKFGTERLPLSVPLKFRSTRKISPQSS